MVFDCTWIGASPSFESNPPEYEGAPQMNAQYDSMSRICVNRHTGYVNVCFLDYTVRPGGLKELWKLDWRRDWSTDPAVNFWGYGATPKDWIEWDEGWMATFKFYD